MKSRLIGLTSLLVLIPLVACHGGRPGLAEHKLAFAARDEEAQPRFNTEAYKRIDENPFLAVARNPLSTFSIDVDTASYSNVRRFISQGSMPPKDAVRIEELINYFRYDYPNPEGSQPFSVTTEVQSCPWKSNHLLALIGLQARKIESKNLPPRNLVFLLDVSGSMNEPNKLPMLKASLALLVQTLTSRDRVAMVVYAGASGLVLPPTSGDQKDRILAALSLLEAGGSTNGGEGIQLAYRVAKESFIEEGVNRVILATDGDFNVGVTSEGELTRLIEEKRASGVFLSVLGFGMGNLKDSTMEMLAQRGNGNYAYIDSLHEARKVLVQEGGATLVTIAKDVKIQVEFNPAHVAAYRLIGYENRLLRDEDFRDDKKDAGELGAGHTVTALYELIPPGVEWKDTGVDPLKYQQPKTTTEAAENKEIMTVKLRYKEPQGDVSKLLTHPVSFVPVPSSENFTFAASIAEFGMLLRDSEHKGSATYGHALELAKSALGGDDGGYRREFTKLVEMAGAIAKVNH